MKRKFGTKPKKKLGRIILRLVFIGLFILLGWYIWDYTNPKNFPITRVKIFATYDRIDQEDLQAVISPYLKNGFFYLNFVGLKKQLLTFPWVYKVSLRRQWPDTLVLNVTEQEAILQWGGRALINHRGDVFIPLASTFPEGLPVIFGPEKRERDIYSLYKIASALFSPLDLAIKQMVLTSHHYWEIILGNGAAVYLKEKNPLAQIELLTNIYRRITADRNREPKAIDLRYKSGLAVRWD